MLLLVGFTTVDLSQSPRIYLNAATDLAWTLGPGAYVFVTGTRAATGHLVAADVWVSPALFASGVVRSADLSVIDLDSEAGNFTARASEGALVSASPGEPFGKSRSFALGQSVAVVGVWEDGLKTVNACAVYALP